MDRLILKNIGVLATPFGHGAKSGAGQGELRILRNAYVVTEDGLITAVGTEDAPADTGARVLDAGGCLATPGLVDPHTHLVFGGWRERELGMKLQGVPYLDILKAGGGILSTVRDTRAASEDALFDKAKEALSEMLRLGVTACEAKSGYGLSAEHEMKQLRVVKRLKACQPVELVSTFLAAHAVPEEYRFQREEYIRLIMEEMLPKVAGEGLAEFCDVFCETGVFTAAEARRILLSAKSLGLRSKIHSDEMEAVGGTELAGEIGAISAEHLIAATDGGIQALAARGTVACLLPATSFYLDRPYARARDFISAGVPVAVGSDFNPGSCPGLSLQLAMNIACYKYRMLPQEVLTAVTLNAAAAIGRAETIGSVEEGKQADLLVWNADNLNYIFYRFGSNLVKTVIKRGKEQR